MSAYAAPICRNKTARPSISACRPSGSRKRLSSELRARRNHRKFGLGPIAAGYLFNGGATLPSVAAMMAIGSLLAAVAVFAMRYEEARAS